jgi:hypothetical protein
MVNIPDPQPSDLNIDALMDQAFAGLEGFEVPDFEVPDVDFQDFDIDAAMAEPQRPEPGFLDIPVTAAGELKDLAQGLVIAGGMLTKNLVTDFAGTIQATPGFLQELGGLILDDYRKMFTDPTGEIRRRPLNTMLNLLGLVDVVGFAAGKVGMKGVQTAATKARPFVDPFNTVLPVKVVGRGIPGTKFRGLRHIPVVDKAVHESKLLGLLFGDKVADARRVRELTRQIRDAVNKVDDPAAQRAFVLALQTQVKDIDGFNKIVSMTQLRSTDVLLDLLDNTAQQLGFKNATG